MAERPLWQLTAAELVGKTRAGTVSAQDAVRSALDRMALVNPRLNAVVEDLSREAITRARALDAAVAAGAAPGPLHGVPVTIKVNVDQKGHATTNGVVALKDVIAPGDAPIVENLQAAGAVIIGRTNTPELSFPADTDNPLHGRRITHGGLMCRPEDLLAELVRLLWLGLAHWRMAMTSGARYAFLPRPMARSPSSLAWAACPLGTRRRPPSGACWRRQCRCRD